MYVEPLFNHKDEEYREISTVKYCVLLALMVILCISAMFAFATVDIEPVKSDKELLQEAVIEQQLIEEVR